METKKNSKKDLTQNSGMYFVTGLALVLMLTYVALEWKMFYGEKFIETAEAFDDELNENVDLIQLAPPPPPPPPPAAPDVIEIVENDDDIEEVIMDTTESDQEKEVMKVKEVDFADPEEEIKVNWVTIEEVPVFPGCENENDKRACFQAMMNKHIRKVFRYPEIAIEMGSHGKVFTQFTIEKDGSIGNILLKGTDKNLEKEAQRIISKLPKMKPGKQREKNVKVSFAIPINFVLN